MSSRPLHSVVLLAIVTAGCHEELGIGTTSAVRPEVEALELQGVKSLDESRLRSVLATRESPWLPWRQPRYFDREPFDQDLKRIVAFYGDHGFPNAEIVSHDVDPVDGGHGVRVRIAISEGDPLIVSDIRLEGFDVLRPDVIDRLRRDLPLHPGDRLVVQQAIAAGDAAASALRNHGYPRAEVKLDREARDGGVVLVLRAQPGRLAFFGRIDIAGNASVNDEVIRRELLYRPGELFRQTDVRQSVRELQALELFQYANIELVEPGSESDGRTVDPNVMPTRVTVAEGDHRRLEFSLGYGTEEKARAEAEWRHVNFYGGARTLGLHGKWSWLDRGIEGTFVQPYFGLPQLSLTMQGQAWYADEPAFDALSRGGRATVEYRLGRNASASGTVQYQFQSSRIANEALLDPSFRDELIALGLNPTTGEQDGTLVSLGANLQWTRTDAPIDPRRGYILLLDVQQAGGWLPGTYHYISVLSSVPSTARNSDESSASSSHSTRQVVLSTQPDRSPNEFSTARYPWWSSSHHPGAGRRRPGCSSRSPLTSRRWPPARTSERPIPCTLAARPSPRGPPSSLAASATIRRAVSTLLRLRRSRTKRCVTRRHGRARWPNRAGATSNGRRARSSRAHLRQRTRRLTWASSTSSPPMCGTC